MGVAIISTSQRRDDGPRGARRRPRRRSSLHRVLSDRSKQEEGYVTSSKKAGVAAPGRHHDDHRRHRHRQGRQGHASVCRCGQASTLVQEASSVRVEPAEKQPRVAHARGLAARAPGEHRARRVEGLRAQARAGRRRLPRAGAGQEPEPDARLLAPGGLRGAGGHHDRDADRRRKSSSRARTSSSVGQVAAEIRAYRPPEPYKGKGVRYSGERIELKEAKKK